jgi:hypothetical protein
MIVCSAETDADESSNISASAASALRRHVTGNAYQQRRGCNTGGCVGAGAVPSYCGAESQVLQRLSHGSLTDI